MYKVNLEKSFDFHNGYFISYDQNFSIFILDIL